MDRDTPDQSEMVLHMPFLERMAVDAGVIIEIGVGHGNGSTRAFSRGLVRSIQPSKIHVMVDCDPERPQIKPETTQSVESWVVTGPSESIKIRYTVQNILLSGRYADIIFIDTVHTYEQMEKELPVWAPLAGELTLWIFHDTHMFGIYNPMTDAIKEFANKHGWIYRTHTTESHGLGLMWKGKWRGTDVAA